MFKRVFTVATGELEIQAGQQMPGWASQMSYRRLAALLQETQAIKGETLTHIVIGSQGIELRFKQEVPK